MHRATRNVRCFAIRLPLLQRARWAAESLNQQPVAFIEASIEDAVARLEQLRGEPFPESGPPPVPQRSAAYQRERERLIASGAITPAFADEPEPRETVPADE